MKSARHYFDLDDKPIDLCRAIIRSAPLNHPQGAVAYRIEADDGVFAFATDTEPGSTFHDKAPRDLCQRADVLVYDSFCTPGQMRRERKECGHSW